MKKVCIVGGGGMYATLFSEMGYSLIHSVDGADLVCFTGGADVSPSLYGHKEHRQTFSNSSRDEMETIFYKEALKLNIPMVGICRGGQFLNVMSGGEMYQDVSKHTFAHDMVDVETGESIYVTSTHHQMMKPNDRAIIVATAKLGGFREWWNGSEFVQEISDQDIEVVYYLHTNCLCFQPHPEFGGPSFIGMKTYFASLLERFFGVKE